MSFPFIPPHRRKAAFHTWLHLRLTNWPAASQMLPAPGPWSGHFTGYRATCRVGGEEGTGSVFGVPWKKLINNSKERAVTPEDRAVQNLYRFHYKKDSAKSHLCHRGGPGERNSLPPKTRKLRPKSKWKMVLLTIWEGLRRDQISHHASLPAYKVVRQQATKDADIITIQTDVRMAYLQSQTHLQHSGLWLRKAPFCGVGNGDLGLTVSELRAGVWSVLAENSKSFWFTWQLNYSKHPVPHPACLAPPTTHSHWVGFFFFFNPLHLVLSQLKWNSFFKINPLSHTWECETFMT